MSFVIVLIYLYKILRILRIFVEYLSDILMVDFLFNNIY